MVVKFKFNQGNWVWYLHRNFLGGTYTVIGKGIVEKLSYDSGWLNQEPICSDEADPQYCIRIGKARWLTACEHDVFKKFTEARAYAKSQNLDIIPHHFILREKGL